MKKNLIVLVILIIIFCFIFSFGSRYVVNNQTKHYYAKSMVVFNLDKENDIVVLKDAVGNTWNFEGIEDWELNDICSCLMYDNDTESIYDDIILSTRYDGQVVGWIIK